MCKHYLSCCHTNSQNLYNLGKLQLHDFFKLFFYRKKNELDELKKQNDVENCKKVHIELLHYNTNISLSTFNQVSSLAKEIGLELGFDPSDIKTVEISKVKKFATDLYEYAQTKHYLLDDDGKQFKPQQFLIQLHVYPRILFMKLTEECPYVTLRYKLKGPFSTRNSTKFLPFFELETPKDVWVFPS